MIASLILDLNKMADIMTILPSYINNTTNEYFEAFINGYAIGFIAILLTVYLRTIVDIYYLLKNDDQD